MNAYRITFVNPAFAPHPSYTCVDAATPAEAIAQFWASTNPRAVLDRKIYRLERQVTVIDGRTPHGRTEWREEKGVTL